jgi:integrase
MLSNKSNCKSIILQEHNPVSINPDSIISRTENGDIISVYKDILWNFHPYTDHKERSKIHFSGFSEENRGKFKWIIYCLYFWTDIGIGGVVSISTLRQYKNTISSLDKFLDKYSYSFDDFLASKDLITKYIRPMDQARRNLFITLINKLLQIDKDILKIDPILVKITIDPYRQVITESKQTAPIPERIYSEVISQSQYFLSEMIKNIDEFSIFINKISDIPGYAQTKHSQRKKHRHSSKDGSMQPEFMEALSYGDLSIFLEKYNINNCKDLGAFILQVQTVCRVILHAYSGMRRGEVAMLPLNSLLKTNSNSREFYQICGFVTKGKSKIIKTKWVTSKDILNAHLVARSLSICISKDLNLSENKMSLFVRHTYLNWLTHYKSDIQSDGYVKNVLTENLKLSDSIYNFEKFRISQDDLNFLYKVDRFRNWKGEDKYQIGEIWNFATHQFRRSLALYSIDCGFVSISTLKYQLKHINITLTMHYIKSFKLNKCYEFDKSLVDEVKEAAIEATAFTYHSKIIKNTDNNLYGANGIKIINIHNKTREALHKDVKNGVISYKETLLGACTSTEKCSKRPMGLMSGTISSCINCKDTVIDKTKLAGQIKRFERFADLQPKGTVEYSIAYNELTTLNKCLNTINHKNYVK